MTDHGMVTLVARISAEEEYLPHGQHVDAATVTMTAVISAVEERGWCDAATAEVVAIIQSVNVREHTDAATVTLVGIPSGTDGKSWSDAATISLVGEVSGTDVKAGVDAATVTMIGIPSATLAQSHNYEDTGRVILRAVISGVDGKEYTDAATVSVVGVPSGSDLKAKEYTDADTVDLVTGDPGQQDTFQGVDAATVTLVGVPSGVDGKAWSDAATVTLVGVPSGTDIKAKGYTDAATATVIGIPSGVEDYTPGGGGGFGDNENYVAFLYTFHDNGFQDQPNYTDGIFTATTSGGGAGVNFAVVGNSRMVNPPNFSDSTVAAYQDDSAGHFVTDLPWIERTYTDGDWQNGAIIIRVGDGVHGPNAASGTTGYADVTYVPDQGGAGLDGISVDVSSLNSTDLCFFFIAQDIDSFIDVPTTGFTQLADYDDPDMGVHVAVWVGLRGAHTELLANFDTDDVSTMAIVTAVTQPGVWTSTRYAVLDFGLTTFTGTSNRFTSASHPEV